MLSWQDNYTYNMTYKPSKLGQTDLVLSLQSTVPQWSVRTGSQVSMCSGYDLCHSR